MIRKATLSDSAALRALLTEVMNLAHPSIPVNELKLVKTVQRYLSNPQCVCFVSDVDGVKGLLAASVSPLEIADGKAATDHVFYCKSGEGKKLINAYIEWAKDKQAVMINMTVSSGVKRADKLIEASGFKRSGGCYYYE